MGTGNNITLAALSEAYDRLEAELRQCRRDEQRKISVITKAQTDLLKWMREASNKTTVIEESING